MAEAEGASSSCFLSSVKECLTPQAWAPSPLHPLQPHLWCVTQCLRLLLLLGWLLSVLSLCFPAFLRCNWQNYVHSKCTICCFDIYIYIHTHCEVINTMKLINISITLYSCLLANLKYKSSIINCSHRAVY